MTTTVLPVRTGATDSTPTGRLRGAAATRILFGLIWAADATFKWLPGFVHGQTLDKELGGAAKIQVPVLHQWMELWHTIAMASPATFAVGTAVVETIIAVCLLVGAFSNLILIGSAVFSFGIWSTAEGFHLPWDRAGITDLGPSVGYIAASLALFFALGGAVWSVDGWLRPKLGKLAWLCSPAA